MKIISKLLEWGDRDKYHSRLFFWKTRSFSAGNNLKPESRVTILLCWPGISLKPFWGKALERSQPLWIVFRTRSEGTLNINTKKFKIGQLTSNISSQSSRSLMLIVPYQKFSLTGTFMKICGRQLSCGLTMKFGTNSVGTTWLQRQPRLTIKPKSRLLAAKTWTNVALEVSSH